MGWEVGPLLRFPQLPRAGPVPLTLLSRPPRRSSVLRSLACVSRFLRGRQGLTAVSSELGFCKHFCVWRHIPDVSVERRVVHGQLLLCHLVPPSGRFLLLAENPTRISPICAFLAPWGTDHPLFWISISSIYLAKHLEDGATILLQTNKTNQKKKRKRGRLIHFFFSDAINITQYPGKKMFSWDPPGSSAVRTGPANAGSRRFNSWAGSWDPTCLLAKKKKKNQDTKQKQYWDKFNNNFKSGPDQKNIL